MGKFDPPRYPLGFHVTAFPSFYWLQSCMEEHKHSLFLDFLSQFELEMKANSMQLPLTVTSEGN